MKNRLLLALSLVLIFGLTNAWAGPTQCAFSKDNPLIFGARGNSQTLIKNGFVDVNTPAVYSTPFTVDIELWVDDSFAKLASDAPALALSYFEHANCILALGKNQDTGTSNHSLSFRLKDNRIHYYPITTPPVPGNSLWIQQVHWDFYQHLKSPGINAPKLNILITARAYTELDKATGAFSVGVSGASNGVGQGQSIIGVYPAWFRNGMAGRSFAEDWWGEIIAHEGTHALGRGGHTAQKFDTMCCSAADYPDAKKGTYASKLFSMDDNDWSMVVKNNFGTDDIYPDPYVTDKNPVTHQNWNYLQIHFFLNPYTTAFAVSWAKNTPDCRNSSEDASALQCRNLKAYKQCLVYFPYSPTCNRNAKGVLTEPCCLLFGGW